VTFRTVEGVLHPDGTLTLPQEELPGHPVRVMVTLLEATDDAALAELGDYAAQLADYEERLARGEIRWQ
jgi:hypothetical protein